MDLLSAPVDGSVMVPSLQIWMSTYRTLYEIVGLPLVTPHPGAEGVLRTLKGRRIPYRHREQQRPQSHRKQFCGTSVWTISLLLW